MMELAEPVPDVDELDEEEKIVDFISRTPPFRYLKKSEKEVVAPFFVKMTYSAGDVIIRANNDDKDLFLFVVMRGTVVFMDVGRTPPAVVGMSRKGGIFGERAILLDEERKVQVVAKTKADLLLLPADRFLQLAHSNTAFTGAVAHILQSRQNVFERLNDFSLYVLSLATKGAIHMKKALRKYMELAPALHSKMHSSEIDVSAWMYALKRLPENVTTTFVYLLATNAPTYFADNDSTSLLSLSNKSKLIATDARRRTVFEFCPGKSFVYLRDHQTDLLDFVTCLCVHVVEAGKLRRRLNGQGQALIQQLVNFSKPESTGRTLSLRTSYCESDNFNSLDEILQRAGFSDAEITGLGLLFPDTQAAIVQMFYHHEDYNIQFRRDLNTFSIGQRDTWLERIRMAAVRLTKSADFDDVDVHIISSNTHSVRNCLSPFPRRYHQDIEAWADMHMPHLTEAETESFKHKENYLYFAMQAFLKSKEAENRSMADLRSAIELDHNFVCLTDHFDTGVRVQVVDVSKFDLALMDPVLGKYLGHALPRCRRQSLIVNMDYTFGNQTVEVLGMLILLFGHSIKSINVLGKAGSLQGSRGDIMKPTHIIAAENTNEIIRLPNDNMMAQSLSDISGRDVHEGPMITVQGTLLQSRAMLNFYQRLYKCIGLEMEGIFFARHIQKSIAAGHLSADVTTRFLYYTSDLPLDPNSNLSQAMKPWEGIPPLYAITRLIILEVLRSIAPDPCADAPPAEDHPSVWRRALDTLKHTKYSGAK